MTGAGAGPGGTPSTAGAPSTVLWRGLTRRCPVCGGGGLFRRWFSMAPRCPRCGFRFEREQGHWVGSLGVNTIVSFGALLATIVGGVIATAPDIPVVPLTVASCAVAVAVPLLAFPFTRTIWSAIDLLMNPPAAGELARPAPDTGAPDTGVPNADGSDEGRADGRGAVRPDQHGAGGPDA